VTLAARTTEIAKLIPIVGWSSNYWIDCLRFDFMAGLTAAAVAILQAMAFATVAMQPATVRACVVPAGDGSLGKPEEGARCP
jgi:hypothetical protein